MKRGWYLQWRMYHKLGPDWYDEIITRSEERELNQQMPDVEPYLLKKEPPVMGCFEPCYGAVQKAAWPYSEIERLERIYVKMLAKEDFETKKKLANQALKKIEQKIGVWCA